jgi:hypothetical protein
MKRIFSGLFFILIYAGFADAAEPKLVKKTISLGDMHTDWGGLLKTEDY